MAAREEHFYWKEIVGTLIWVGLLIWLFQPGNIEGCRDWIEEKREEISRNQS